MKPPGAVTLFTHHYPADTAAAVASLLAATEKAGIEVRLPPEEVEKHGIEERPGVVCGADPAADVDLAIVFGGDGTLLGAMREFAGRPVPVFAFNFGKIGFLSTVDRHELDEGLERALSGEFEVHPMPVLAIDTADGPRVAVNDVSIHRRAHSRVAELAYSVEGDRLGQVRCDGLVASTPVGSTGYNLANGGPVLAWGVEGFVVSFIAPHTLTARTLVVATDDVLNVLNTSEDDAVDVMTDGRIVGELPPQATLDVRFEQDRVHIAQLPGATFYKRLREKFGQLAY